MEHKLFIKIKCSICFGSTNDRNGRSCPYCTAGETYIEASNKQIKEYLRSIPECDRLGLLDEKTR